MSFLKAVFDKGRGGKHEDIMSLGGRRGHDGLQRVCTEGKAEAEVVDVIPAATQF